MDLYKNMLFEWNGEPGQSRVERLLWFEPDGEMAVTICINDPKARPVQRVRGELETAVVAGEARVLTIDPYAPLCQRPEHEIKKAHRRHRDKYWDRIAPLVESGDPRVFTFHARNSPIMARARELGCDKTVLYDHLRRYWQRGQIKNALLPSFDRCGWRDRSDEARKKEGDEAREEVKLGRRSSLSKVTEHPTGVNVNEDILSRFRSGIKLFYEKREKRTLRDAYQRTLERFFNVGYSLNDDGALVPVLPPAHELPTYRQFRYWYRKGRDPRRSQIARDGEARFNLSGRAILGDSTQMAFGPGSVYQIDATVADVYLVSSLDRSRIIGRPVVHYVKDLYSRVWAGFSVTLEGPNWTGAMLAVEHAASDKVAFCAEYEITIEEADWPSRHLPESIVADRGELEGYNADHIVNAFNIRVQNTPPYRAEMKGMIEQHVDICNERATHWVPGAVRRRERGDRDYRLDAALDIHEFRKLMALCALDYNRNHLLNGYRLDKDMIADHVEPTPLNLWNWGVRNRSGHLRKVDPDTLRLNLLPTLDASITARGIRCEGLFYTCERALEEGWFVRARENGAKKIRVARDPRNLDRVYLRLGGDRRAEVCHLIEADKTFRGCDRYEVEEEFELRKQRAEAARTRKQQSDAEFNARREKLVAEAKAKTAQAGSGESDSARVKGIRGNRRAERAAEHEAAAWKLGGDAPGAASRAASKKRAGDTPSNLPAGYVPPPQPTDKLRRLRERRQGK
ncbi:MAG: DDE-type integrase/transposase/recombinase [Acidobacteria bacterium]|nr:DDE-type integrase/transposase/recombinase [Acidobacteriota bacterium]